MPIDDQVLDEILDGSPAPPATPPAQDGTPAVPVDTSAMDSILDETDAQIAEQGVLDYDIDWRQLLSNIPGDIVKQYEDLASVVANPVETGKGMLQLFGEIFGSAVPPTALASAYDEGKVPIKRATPITDAIADYYINTYDLITFEGRQKFQKYVEEQPVAFASDVAALIGAFASGGTALGLKGLQAPKYLKMAGRVAEFGVDPGSAIGRAAGDLTSSIGTTRRKRPDTEPPVFSNNIVIQQIYDEAWADGFKPNALKDYLRDNRDSFKLLLSDADYEFLDRVADMFTQYSKPKQLQKWIDRGKRYGGTAIKAIGVGAGVGLQEWHYALIGYFGGDVLERMLSRLSPTTVNYVLTTPPDWADIATKAGVAIGRTTQRAGRISNEEE